MEKILILVVSFNQWLQMYSGKVISLWLLHWTTGSSVRCYTALLASRSLQACYRKMSAVLVGYSVSQSEISKPTSGRALHLGKKESNSCLRASLQVLANSCYLLNWVYRGNPMTASGEISGLSTLITNWELTNHFKAKQLLKLLSINRCTIKAVLFLEWFLRC